MKVTRIPNFNWWLDLRQTNTIADNALTIAKNVQYNLSQQLQTRNWYEKIFDELTAPIHSYFFHERDDTWARIVLAFSGTKCYTLDTNDDWDEIKTWLTQFYTDWAYTRRSFAVYKNIVYMCDWINKYASRDWTTYTEYASEPKYRYLVYLYDTIIGAWVTDTPNTLYVSNTAPTNANTINNNAIVVWWDEQGAITGLYGYEKWLVVFKTHRTYYVDLASEQVVNVDVQNGTYASRSVQAVGNGIVYLTNQGVDMLSKRDWVIGGTAIQGGNLTEKVNSLFQTIKPISFNTAASLFDTSIGNYYLTYDTDTNSFTDTTLVYSSTVWWRTQRTYPGVLCYWIYKEPTGEVYKIFSNGAWWQLYKINVGSTDDWSDIDYEIQTKPYDMWDIAQYKTFHAIDIIWYKQESWTLETTAIIEWDEEWFWEITDANIQIQVSNAILSYETLWVWVLGTWDTTPDLYPFTARMYIPAVVWRSVALNIKSTNTRFILESARVSYTVENTDTFYYQDLI